MAYDVDIIRVSDYTLLRTKISYSPIYYYAVESCRLYYDYNNRRSSVAYKLIETELARVRLQAAVGQIYYVWETNELWEFTGVWVLLAGSHGSDPTYYHGIGPDDIIKFTDTGLVDNNGLMGDGSVIIRDAHGAVKGRLFVDVGNDNSLTLSSFAGAGFTFLPYAVNDTRVSIPSPVFKYKTYVDEETGETVVTDEIEMIELENNPAPLSLDIGRVDMYIRDGVDSTGQYKDLIFSIYNVVKARQRYRYDSSSDTWNTDGELVYKFNVSIRRAEDGEEI